MSSISQCLTPNRIKASIFGRDKHFIDAMAQATSVWPCSDDLCRRLWNSASLLLRPDAIAGRRSCSIFPALREHGLVPAVVRPVRLTRHQTTALWLYQANVATEERLTLLRVLMSVGQSVYIVFSDNTVRASAPATVHLTYLKGTAIVTNRRRFHLRTIAGPPIANALSYVHVSDDPADMLREMAVLFNANERREILSSLDAQQDRTAEAIGTISRLERLAPKSALYLDTVPGDPGSWLTSHHDYDEAGLHAQWHDIVSLAKRCKSFITGETYNGNATTIPDDKALSLPLDSHLVFPELGPR